MTTISSSHMVIFLILILIFSLFITYIILDAKKTKENYTGRGRDPNSPPKCCGNIDWYLGEKKYNEYCPQRQYYGKLQETFTGADSFIKESNECKDKGLKLAYNPSVCTVNDEYEPSANCKCVDDKNKCKECYAKIDLSKY